MAFIEIEFSFIMIWINIIFKVVLATKFMKSSTDLECLSQLFPFHLNLYLFDFPSFPHITIFPQLTDYSCGWRSSTSLTCDVYFKIILWVKIYKKNWNQLVQKSEMLSCFFLFYKRFLRIFNSINSLLFKINLMNL